MSKRPRPTCSFKPNTDELEKLAGASSLAFGGMAAAAIPIAVPPPASDLAVAHPVPGEAAGRAFENVISYRPSSSIHALGSLTSVVAATRVADESETPRAAQTSRDFAPLNTTAGGMIRPLDLAPSTPPVEPTSQRTITLTVPPPISQPMSLGPAVGAGGGGSASPAVGSGPVANAASAFLTNGPAQSQSTMISVVSVAPDTPAASNAANSTAVHSGARAAAGRIAEAKGIASSVSRHTNLHGSRRDAGRAELVTGDRTGGMPVSQGGIATGGADENAAILRGGPIMSGTQTKNVAADHKTATKIAIDHGTGADEASYIGGETTGTGTTTATGSGTGTATRTQISNIDGALSGLATGANSGYGTGSGTGTTYGSSSTGTVSNTSAGTPSGWTSSPAKYTIPGTGGGGRTPSGGTSPAGPSTTGYLHFANSGDNEIGGLAAIALSGGGGAALSDIHWSVSGTVYSGQVIDDTGIYDTTYDVSTDHADTISFFWGRTPGVKVVTATATITVGTQSTSATATATITVAGPGWNAKIVYSTEVGIKPYNGNDWLVWGKAPTFGAAPYGIDWSGITLTDPSKGTLSVIQTFNSGTVGARTDRTASPRWVEYVYSLYKDSSGKIQSTVYPIVDSPFPPFYPATADSPGVRLNSGTIVKLTMDATDVDMFKPTRGIYEPLIKWTWNFDAVARLGDGHGGKDDLGEYKWKADNRTAPTVSKPASTMDNPDWKTPVLKVNKPVRKYS